MAVTASARAEAAPQHGCPDGYGCLWKDANYITANSNDASFRTFDKTNTLQGRTYRGTTHTANDTASSMANASSRGSVFYAYRDANGGGWVIQINANISSPNLTTFASAHEVNDRISSVRFTGYSF